MSENKGTGVTNSFIKITNNKLGGFPFMVISPKSNALSYSSLLHFYALLEGFIWDIRQLRRYSPLDGLHVVKTVFYYLFV